MRHRTGKYTVCRRVRAPFSPEIVRVGAGVNSCLRLEQPLWKTQIVNIASPLERGLIYLIAKGLGEDSNKSSGRFFCAELLPVIFNCWIAKGLSEFAKSSGCFLFCFLFLVCLLLFFVLFFLCRTVTGYI